MTPPKPDHDLIAEFMGYINTTSTDRDFNIYEHPETKKLIETMSMQYHTSWDWLMPVVEKIEGLGYWITIVGNEASIQNLSLENIGVEIFGIKKLEATYKAVVEFIKYLNEKHNGKR